MVNLSKTKLNENSPEACTLLKKFFCEICGDSCEDYHELRTHIMQRHRERKLKCPVCFKAFNSNFDLYSHIKTHQQSCIEVLSSCMWFCDRCGKGFHDIKELFLVHNDEHNSERFACSRCERTFKTTFLLDAHFTESHIETNRIYLMCTRCSSGKIFLDIESYVLHMRNIHQIPFPSYKCFFCDNIFITESSFRIHLFFVHYLNKIYKCIQCTCGFKTSEDLHSHESLKHSQKSSTDDAVVAEISIQKPPTIEESTEDAGISKVSSEASSYTCPRCKVSFKTEIHMRSHLNVFCKERNQECNSTKEKTKLVEVEAPTEDEVITKVSSEASSYTCPRCKVSFKTEIHMRTHLNVFCKERNQECNSTKEKTKFVEVEAPTEDEVITKVSSEASSYTCPRCKVSFKTEIHMRTHLNVFCKERNQECNSTKEKTKLVEAEAPSEDVGITKVSSEASSYTCPRCKVSFKTEIHMRSHLNIFCKELTNKDTKQSVETIPKGCTGDSCKPTFKGKRRRPTKWFRLKEWAKNCSCDNTGDPTKKKPKLVESATETEATTEGTGRTKVSFGASAYTCPTCKESFKNVIEMCTHLEQEKKLPNDAKQNVETIPKVWKCDKCKGTFKSKQRLDKHLRLKHPVFKYSCETCNHSFKTSVMYNNHQNGKDHKQKEEALKRQRQLNKLVEKHTDRAQKTFNIPQYIAYEQRPQPTNYNSQANIVNPTPPTPEYINPPGNFSYSAASNFSASNIVPDYYQSNFVPPGYIHPTPNYNATPNYPDPNNAVCYPNTPYFTQAVDPNFAGYYNQPNTIPAFPAPDFYNPQNANQLNYNQESSIVPSIPNNTELVQYQHIPAAVSSDRFSPQPPPISVKPNHTTLAKSPPPSIVTLLTKISKEVSIPKAPPAPKISAVNISDNLSEATDPESFFESYIKSSSRSFKPEVDDCELQCYYCQKYFDKKTIKTHECVKSHT